MPGARVLLRAGVRACGRISTHSLLLELITLRVNSGFYLSAGANTVPENAETLLMGHPDGGHYCAFCCLRDQDQRAL